MSDRDRRHPSGTAEDFRRVLADLAEAQATGRAPEEIQQRRHEREKAALAERLRHPRRGPWWRRLFRL